MKLDPKDLDNRQLHHLGSSAFVPRPVILVSTIGEDGIFNVAPFGTATRVSHKPLLIGFEIGTRRDGQEKDTLRNIESVKEFVVSVVTEDMAEAMNIASADYPRGIDEFKESGLTPIKADIVKPPMVGESPVNFECKLLHNLRFGQFPRLSNFIIGEVVLAHIKDGLYVGGYIESAKLKAIGRIEPGMYCRITDTFKLETIHQRD